MQIKDYLGEILSKVAANPYVELQNISFEERPPDTALDPKVRGVSTYPEHKHTPAGLVSARKPTLDEVLREITELITLR